MSPFNFNKWRKEAEDALTEVRHEQATKKQTPLGGLPSDSRLAEQKNPTKSSVQRGQKHWTGNARPDKRGNAKQDEREVLRRLELRQRGGYSGEAKRRLVLEFTYTRNYDSPFKYSAPLTIEGYPDLLRIGVYSFMSKNYGLTHKAVICLRLLDGTWAELHSATHTKSVSKALSQCLGKKPAGGENRQFDLFLFEGSQWWNLYELVDGITFIFPKSHNVTLPDNPFYSIKNPMNDPRRGMFFFESPPTLSAAHGIGLDEACVEYDVNPYYVLAEAEPNTKIYREADL